jgi:endonuclease/exonuclease/phosphatase family metal-dependent hydrolase
MDMSKKLKKIAILLTFLVFVSCRPEADNPENLGLTDPTPDSLPKTIRLVVFATQCPLPTDCTQSYIDKAAAQVSALNPDIVVATEFFWKKENYTRFAEKTGLKYHFRGPGDDQNAVTGGVVVLSRFPFSKVAKDPFQQAVLPDSLVKKGTVIGKIRIGKTQNGIEIPVNVIGTHLQAKAIGDWAATQNQQIGQQANWIKNQIKNDEISIFSGDFNLTQNVPQWLCDNDQCRDQILRNWNKLVDEILNVKRFLSMSQICRIDVDPIPHCLSQKLEESQEQASSVIKSFISNGTSFSYHGVSLVPRQIRSVQTISDHLTWIHDLEVIHIGQ